MVSNLLNITNFFCPQQDGFTKIMFYFLMRETANTITRTRTKECDFIKLPLYSLCDRLPYDFPKIGQ